MKWAILSIYETIIEDVEIQADGVVPLAKVNTQGIRVLVRN
jgi:hypothetical protein